MSTTATEPPERRSGRLPARTVFAASVGAAVSGLSRRLGRGRGSVIGGRAVLAIDPTALERLAEGRHIALVSGTNGKTTTTSLLGTALATSAPVVTNLLGANLPPGITSALAGAPASVQRAALEVDEAWLARVITATRPMVAVLLNLTRDQLDRNNEVRRLSSAWRDAIAASPGLRVVANADDPLVAWAAGQADEVTWVGAGQPWTADASGCPACGWRIDFGPDGWACASCGRQRPALDVRVEDHHLLVGGERLPLTLALPGRCNEANAAMAAAAAACFGVAPADAIGAMAATSEVAGRYRWVRAGATRARLLLAKNPAGWLEVFDMLAPAPAPVVVAINARIADGKDPSWLWDVPFERLRGRLVVATGERSRDLAVRLHYAEVEHRHEPDPTRALAAARAPVIDVVANYTSFQAISAGFPDGG